MAAPTVGSTSPSVSLAARSATAIGLGQQRADLVSAAGQRADLGVGAESAAGRVHLGEVVGEQLAGLGQGGRVGDDQVDQRAEGTPAG